MPTSIARNAGVTAVWFNDRVVSAWYDDGELANLFMAHALTALLPRTNEDLAHFTPRPAVCEHGLSPNLCTVCPSNPSLWPAEPRE